MKLNGSCSDLARSIFNIYMTMNSYLLKSYYKITDVINSCETPDHINAANNMILNLKDRIECMDLELRPNIFGWKFWKWWKNYMRYNEIMEFAYMVESDLNQLLSQWVEQYNKAVEEATMQAEAESLDSMYKNIKVKGFKDTSKNKRKSRGKKNNNTTNS